MPGFGDRTDTVLAPITARPPDQVAYVVEDLESAVQDLGRRFGVRRWLGWRYANGYLPNRTYRGRPGDFETWGVVAEFGPSLEICAPLSGSGVFTEFLEQHGPGLHHLGYFVPSLDDERARLRALGLEEVQYGGGHGMDGDGQIAFYETVGGAASYLEVIEPPKRRYPPHFEIIVDGLD
jgi:methylmalonyl-CoA/ethylmalonyl-CoA epimerase